MVEVMTDKATVTITAPKAGVVVETRGQCRRDRPGPLGARRLRARRSSGPRRPSHSNGHEGDDPALRGDRDPRPRRSGSFARRCRESAGRGATSTTSRWQRRPREGSPGRWKSTSVECLRPDRPGRVTRGDVEGFRPGPEATRAPAPSAASPLAPTRTPASDGARDGREERVPLAGVRRRIAQKMAQSKSTAAHFTFVEECDVDGAQGPARAPQGRGRGAGGEAELPPLHREGRRRGAEEAPHPQHDARRGATTRSSSASTSISASPRRRTRGSWCRS